MTGCLALPRIRNPFLVRGGTVIVARYEKGEEGNGDDDSQRRKMSPRLPLPFAPAPLRKRMIRLLPQCARGNEIQ